MIMARIQNTYDEAADLGLGWDWEHHHYPKVKLLETPTEGEQLRQVSGFRPHSAHQLRKYAIFSCRSKCIYIIAGC